MDGKYKAKYPNVSANIEAIEEGNKRAIFEIIFRMAGKIENSPKRKKVSMRRFILEVYSDNDITEQEIFVELLSRFGNMIASVKEESSQQGAHRICATCGASLNFVGHGRYQCPNHCLVIGTVVNTKIGRFMP